MNVKVFWVADWNFMRTGIMHLLKVSGEPWCVNEQDNFGVFKRKSVEFVKRDFVKNQTVELGLFVVDIAYCWILTFSFSSSVFTTIIFFQVTGGQWSCCLFIFVSVHAWEFVSTSNPALGSLCPLQAQCQQLDFDVKPQFIRLSLWTPMLST